MKNDSKIPHVRINVIGIVITFILLQYENSSGFVALIQRSL